MIVDRPGIRWTQKNTKKERGSPPTQPSILNHQPADGKRQEAGNKTAETGNK